ncbi:MAG: HDOD domain-containing protein [Verrucomicrobia bacterium]|nr:HDOD domain-containing protein [Verrucomicrobiota bacterium]
MIAAQPISRERILTVARLLPAAPQAMAGLYELLQELNADLGRIADQIRVDPALAARVVRMSNSVAWGGGGSVGSVEGAVSRLGFGELLRLVGAATVTTMVDRNLAGYGVQAERLRESLLLHALASESLARFSSLDPRTAYTAGLLRAIGMMVIARAGSTGRGFGCDFDPERYDTYAQWEGEWFGVSSPEVAALVLREWRFPPDMVEAIRGHLQADGETVTDSFACLLNLAGSIVADAGLALGGEVRHWKVTEARLAAAGITAEQMEAAREQAMAEYSRTVDSLV